MEALDLALEVFDDIPNAVNGSAAVVITNNHPAFGSVGVSGLTRGLLPSGFVYDFWNHFSDVELHIDGIGYHAVGNVRRTPA
jgi:UDP-N-acetyl-D-mannosaminuronic acid dehydrogenase